MKSMQKHLWQRPCYAASWEVIVSSLDRDDNGKKNKFMSWAKPLSPSQNITEHDLV